MWSNDIHSIIFTKIKYFATKKLKDKFPDIYFTTSSRATKKARFPTVYVRQLQGMQNPASKDLERCFMVGKIISIQIEVTDNSSQDRADEVAEVIDEIMVKKLFFDQLGEPVPDDSNPDVFRTIARYTQKKDYNDLV